MLSQYDLYRLNNTTLNKPSAQSSYLAQWLERLIASDFSAHENFFQKNTPMRKLTVSA